MKSWIKKWFIAAGIMIAAGIIICAGIFTASGFKISVFNTSKERVKKEENIIKNYIVNLYLETSSNEVILKKTTSKDFISVTYYESEDITFDFIDTSYDDGTLKIIENDNSKWYNMMFMFDFQDTPLIVEIPEDEWEKITISTSSGDILIDQINCQELNADASSGEIKASNLSVQKEALFDTSSGDVFGTIKGDDNTVSFITDTSSGDVSVPSPSKGEKTFSASTSSGDIEIAFSK